MLTYYLDGPMKGQLEAHPYPSLTVTGAVLVPSTPRRHYHDDPMAPVYTKFTYEYVGEHEGTIVMAIRP